MRTKPETMASLQLLTQQQKQNGFEMMEREMMLLKTPPSHVWWFESHKSPKQRSPWLQSTLSELDRKTKTMLKLIEEDADSFSQRAEMYYKKRPVVVNIVEDLYRSHRSLAERYDQLKFDDGIRFTTAPFRHSSSIEHPLQKLIDPTDDSYENSSDCFDSEESEVDDPEEEDPEEEDQVDVEIASEQVSSKERDSEVMKLKEEVERLKEENRIQMNELMVKDEEKRDAIRQLCLSMEILEEENSTLRKCLKDLKKRGIFEFWKWKGLLSRKVFG